MANASDKLASMASPLGFLYVILAIAAAQQASTSPIASTAAPVLIDKGVVVSLFPYPYPGHVEMFEGIHPKQMTGATSSTQHPFLQENILITKLVPDPSRNIMYYIDVYTNSIYRWNNVTTTLNDKTVSTINQTSKVFEGLSRAICKLDFDYVAQNIYWSDPLLHWIAMKPVNSDDPADTKILITDDVDYVAALALDAESKYIFWISSAYDDAKLERSNLLGEERQVLLNTSFGFVDDMTLDMKEKRLYWVDSYRMTVETATYNGHERRIIRRLVGTEFTSIAVIESNICLINFDSYEMQCMYKTSGDRYAYHSFYPSNPYAVGFYNEAVQKPQLDNPCASLPCDHICVNTDTQPKCLCADGYTLDSDGQTCTQTNPLYENAVVMTNNTHICMIQVSSLSSASSYKPIRCVVSNVTKDTTHIQSHVARNLLYYTAKGKDTTSSNKTQLVQFELNSQRHWVVVADIEDPDDMAFDWVGEKMFTCHSKLSVIKAWDVVTGRSSIVYTGNFVSKVSELAIDPHRDNIFWISQPSDGVSIYVGTFSGTTPTKLVGSGTLSKPTGISFEYLDDNLCYIDTGRFACVTIAGEVTNQRISVGSATKSLIYKNYAVWNSGQATLKMSLFSLDASVYTTTTTMGTINSIALFSKESQKAFLDPCKIGNGGCEDLCFRKNATVICDCDFGRTLKPDGRGCTATPLTTNFMLATDLSHDRIVQVSMDGNMIVSLPINNLMTPAMARYGHHDNLLYWCEVGSKDIKRGTLNGTRVERMITIGGESYPDRFTIDFTNNHLYYTVAHTQEINQAYIAVMIPKADQAEKKTLIDNLNYVGGIVLHPENGYMYFNNHGPEVYIARADTDGNNIEKMVKFTGGGQPLGMTIDYQSGFLYWTDAYTDQDKIEFIDLEGTTSSRGVLLRDMTSDMVDLTVSAGFLYYVGYNKHEIIKVDLSTKQPVKYMTPQPDFGAIDSVDIVPTANTQPVNTKCGNNNGMCSHYCFSTPSGKKCGCPDGMYLDQNNALTCTTAPPTCPMQIPNGELNPGCSGIVGTSCGYSCTGTTYVKNPSISILNCTTTYFWNVPTDILCIAKSTTQQPTTITTKYTATVHDTSTHVTTTVHNVLTTTLPEVTTNTWISTTTPTTTGPAIQPEKLCPTDMNVGQLVNCMGKANEACMWTCPSNLDKKPFTEAVICLSSGQWSTSLNELCVQKVKCPAAIPNGNLQACSYEAGSSCSVTCNRNYTAEVANIHCLPDGVWDQNIQTLCMKTTGARCSSALPNGAFVGCTYMADKSCQVKCNEGYTSQLDFVHCLPDGVWDKDPKNICELTKVVQPEKLTQAASTAGLTAAVAVVVTLLVIIIILAVAFYFFRRRIFSSDKQNVQGRYRSSPNVYFNASDNRGAAASPAEGYTNPSLHAGNGEAMPNTNPLKMDQITLSDDTTKQNFQNEGHYESIKEGRPVDGAPTKQSTHCTPLCSHRKKLLTKTPILSQKNLDITDSTEENIHMSCY